MTEVTVNGCVYVLDENMSDEELAAWIVERNALDTVMERLNARYSCEELAALGPEQIRAEINSMSERDFDFVADGNKILKKETDFD